MTTPQQAPDPQGPDPVHPPRRRGRRILVAVVASTGVLAVTLLIATWASTEGFKTFGGRPSSAELERITSNPRYSDGHFSNVEPTGVMKGASVAAAVAKAWVFGKEMRAPNCPLPIAADAAEKLRTPASSGLRVTWLGHSTTLIEIDGTRVLTDPVWGERASPSSIAGPKRFHPPPLALDALPHLDAVVISHDHYDHLDMATVGRLAARGVVFHVPLGVGAHLRRWGVPAAQFVEHDWWQVAHLSNGVELVSTPARHFSGRTPFDRDSTLWTSWSLAGPRHRVFFSGDTGLQSAFAEIAERFGPFDLALLEIGQYHPSWGDIHLGPMGALDAFARLHARTLLPIHWCTFQLGMHAWSEPAETLTVEAEKRGMRVLTPRLGEPIEPTTDAPTTAWWRALPPIAAACP